MSNATMRGFPFASLDSVDWLPGEKPGEAPVIVARFDDITATEAAIEGRHLEMLYDLVGHHKVIWVRELPPGKDFKDQAATVVNRISFRPVEPIKRQGGVPSSPPTS